MKRTKNWLWGIGILVSSWAVAPASQPEPVLHLLLKDTPQPDYGSPVPPIVSGRVVLDENGNAGADPQEAGLAGVSISDGYSVVTTGAEGDYTITPNPAAVFINVTRPSGHEVVGSWYRPLAPAVDFLVKPAAFSEEQYTFVQVTDTHISTNPTALQTLSRFVREVNALSPAPRFVLNSGDLLDLSKSLDDPPATGHAYFRNYVGLMNHLAMPYYNVAGDHTDSSYRLQEFPRGDHRCGKPLYWEYLGPHFFSFEYGRIHFMSVDFGYHLGQKQIKVQGVDKEYPTYEVQPMHIAWMQQDLAKRTPGSFVVTTAEYDLSQHCPGFPEMARQYDVRLQLTGDDHIVTYETQGVPYRCGGSLSGCWWNPQCEGLGPDLSPQGYLIYHVRGEELECFYKGVGQRVAIVSPRFGAIWQGEVKIHAHVVQPQPQETLHYSLNGQDWRAMREVDRPFYRALYEATVDSTALPDGLLEFRVRSTADGEVRPCVFVVANGRTSAPPGDGATLTFTVGKAHLTDPHPPTEKVEVLFNDTVMGVLAPQARETYSFPLPAASLKKANTLRFRFAQPADGLDLSRPVLTFQGHSVEDPRAAAIQQVKTSHWGVESATWGGFIVGDGGLREGPFLHRQQEFGFVLGEE